MDIVWYRPGLGAPRVTLAREGVKVSLAAAEAMGMPERVRIGVAPEERCLVVQPCTGDGEGVLPFASRLNRKLRCVRLNNRALVRQLLEHVPLDLSRARTFPAWWDAQKGMLVVPLDEEGRIGRTGAVRGEETAETPGPAGGRSERLRAGNGMLLDG